MGAWWGGARVAARLKKVRIFSKILRRPASVLRYLNTHLTANHQGKYFWKTK